MKISGIIAVAVAAAFIAIPSHAQSRAQLQKDNQSLRHELDSLKAEMEKMREELRYTDSIASEMLSRYRKRKVTQVGTATARPRTARPLIRQNIRQKSQTAFLPSGMSRRR